MVLRSPTNFDAGTVVIFGGSFDPITYTHIQIALEVVNFGLADQVWIVPCGMRPDKDTTVEPRHRYDMACAALVSMVPLACPIYVESTEVDSGRYFPTTELMRVYRARYPKLQFKVLIGNDLLSTLHLWDDFLDLVAENVFMVYSRIQTLSGNLDEEEIVELSDRVHTKLKVERIRNKEGFTATISNISSTEIRFRLKTRGISAIIGLTPMAVVEYIETHNLYPTLVSR